MDNYKKAKGTGDASNAIRNEKKWRLESQTQGQKIAMLGSGCGLEKRMWNGTSVVGSESLASGKGVEKRKT